MNSKAHQCEDESQVGCGELAEVRRPSCEPERPGWLGSWKGGNAVQKPDSTAGHHMVHAQEDALEGEMTGELSSFQCSHMLRDVKFMPTVVEHSL